MSSKFEPIPTRESEAWRHCARAGSAFEVTRRPFLIFGRKPLWLAVEVILWAAVALAWSGRALRISAA